MGRIVKSKLFFNVPRMDIVVDTVYVIMESVCVILNLEEKPAIILSVKTLKFILH